MTNFITRTALALLALAAFVIAALAVSHSQEIARFLFEGIFGTIYSN